MSYPRNTISGKVLQLVCYNHNVVYMADDIIMAALEHIAETDNCVFDYLWNNGYTEVHNSEEVVNMVLDYIHTNVNPDNIVEFYNWGVKKIWIK